MPLDSLPEDLVAFDAKDGAVSLRVDGSLYPLEAIYAAAYVFIDRCFVLLDRPSEGQTRVTLSAKKGELTPEVARDLVGEFVNELLSCAWRSQIARDNRATIEAVTAQALSGARGAPSLEELEAFDFSDDAFEDPLGIAMSWEEKYAKKKAADPKAAAEESKADAEPSEMIELRFHRELYDGKAIDEALKIFGGHATFEQAEEPSHWIVRLTGNDPAREKRIAGELANYALGLTIGSKTREAS